MPQALPVVPYNSSETVPWKMAASGEIYTVSEVIPYSPTVDKSRKYSVLVPKNSVATDPVIIPNGETWVITQYYGSVPTATVASIVSTKITFDGTQLFQCYSDYSYDDHYECVGDGNKQLTITLTNNSTVDLTLASGYRAYKKV